MVVSGPALATGLCNTLIVTLSTPLHIVLPATTKYFVVSDGEAIVGVLGSAIGPGAGWLFNAEAGVHVTFVSGLSLVTDSVVELPAQIVLSGPASTAILLLAAGI